MFIDTCKARVSIVCNSSPLPPSNIRDNINTSITFRHFLFFNQKNSILTMKLTKQTIFNYF